MATKRNRRSSRSRKPLAPNRHEVVLAFALGDMNDRYVAEGVVSLMKTHFFRQLGVDEKIHVLTKMAPEVAYIFAFVGADVRQIRIDLFAENWPSFVLDVSDEYTLAINALKKVKHPQELKMPHYPAGDWRIHLWKLARHIQIRIYAEEFEPKAEIAAQFILRIIRNRRGPVDLDQLADDIHTHGLFSDDPEEVIRPIRFNGHPNGPVRH